MRKISSILVIIFILGFIYLKIQRKNAPDRNQHLNEITNEDESESSSLKKSSNSQIVDKTSKNNLKTQMISSGSLVVDDHPKLAKIDAPKEGESGEDLKRADEILNFRVEDGMAVAAGDIVLGKPTEEVPSGTGYTASPNMQLWPTAEIPVIIQQDAQKNIKDFDRIERAISMFEDTAIRFIRVEPSEGMDALLFVHGTGTCKSYLGKIGGIQPVWIADSCSDADIAHELMHALGFLHEQNRTDRDEYVDIQWSNIEKEFKLNFELFPIELMTVSGAAQFDFESIMMYPPEAFANRPGVKTIVSKNGQQFSKNNRLSFYDKQRIQQIYGNR